MLNWASMEGSDLASMSNFSELSGSRDAFDLGLGNSEGELEEHFQWDIDGSESSVVR